MALDVWQLIPSWEATVPSVTSVLCTFIRTFTDSNLVPEPIQDMFDRVRNSADFMPLWQMEVHGLCKCVYSEPLNKGYLGTQAAVPYSEVVPY